MCRLRVTDQEYDTKTVSLLATSHLFGLVFVGTPDRVVVIKVEDIIQIDEKIVSKKTEVSSFPHKAILLPSSPSFVSLSADNLTLMVCLTKSGCPVGWMYDVRAFARQVNNIVHFACLFYQNCAFYNSQVNGTHFKRSDYPPQMVPL